VSDTVQGALDQGHLRALAQVEGHPEDALSWSEHLNWRCATSGPTGSSFPITFDALLDNGSHLAIVDSDWADKLALKH
jgi:hypothetical protein